MIILGLRGWEQTNGLLTTFLLICIVRAVVFGDGSGGGNGSGGGSCSGIILVAVLLVSLYHSQHSLYFFMSFKDSSVISFQRCQKTSCKLFRRQRLGFVASINYVVFNG